MYSIIGGGICGLTTALAFEKLGIEYKLYEKAEELIPVGAGILLPPNALQVYDWLEILEDIKQKGSEMRRITLTKSDMSPLFDYIQDDIKEKYGFYSVSIHRWELQNILLQKIPKHKIHLNKSFASYKTSEKKVELFFHDGSKVETDYIIGADGIHSRIRKQLFPKSKIRYSGQTCWRGICDYKNISNEYQYRGIEMWGKELRFGITKIEKDKFYWFAVIKSKSNLKDNLLTIKSELSDTFNDFHPIVNHLIDKTSITNIIRSDLYDVNPMPNWYRGNICLIGDAAHATTPNMGQGGAQTIEDAYFLANAIKREQPDNVFNVFQKKRINKVNQIVKQSLMMGKIGHLKYFESLRSFIIKAIPSSLFKLRWRTVYKLG
ncbi:FAD-dependent monooxygenase [Winogradskyella immobilis]|uniref:FAD-dependent monooxygenase n=1 Tax=Winogradskyella immobilis TaxID=2816852 RepID=A0ABS8EQD1_9FLAO|nr:FAD-dependent monooxygenase [Winogradskyella immobilis]MCC1485416.1 FAD-dependent monooxygenase [Winogradskyella immobilis]MCG0017508.1 FAD-dependent monooxygenase [Winogradskyella immobilis]